MVSIFGVLSFDDICRRTFPSLIWTALLFQSFHCQTHPQISLSHVGSCVAWYGEARCWGSTNDTVYITEPPTIPFYLGTEFSANVETLISGSTTNCALSNFGEARCWGYGNTLDTTPFNDPEQSLDLGTGFVIDEGGCGVGHCTFLSKNQTIKCIGSNMHGQCAYGDTEYRGDDVGEIGDSLANVNLGLRHQTVHSK